MANDSGGNRDGLGVVLAAVAIVLCCALPLLAVAVGGVIAAAGGLVARYWPLVVVGVAVAVWAAVKVTRTVRASRHDQRGQRRP